MPITLIAWTKSRLQWPVIKTNQLLSVLWELTKRERRVTKRANIYLFFSPTQLRRVITVIPSVIYKNLFFFVHGKKKTYEKVITELLSADVEYNT